MNLSVDTLASSSAATNLLEAAVRHEAKEIKDQLGEMNQSIDTLASSSAATNQLSRGMFFFFYNGDVVASPFRLWKEIRACFYLRQKLIIPDPRVDAFSQKGTIFYIPVYYIEKCRTLGDCHRIMATPFGRCT